MIAILGWIACSLWCYHLAKKQGRKPFVGVLFGVIFGIIAVIGYYLAGSKKSEDVL